MEPGKYSFGIGDRFGLQGQALLGAIMDAREMGVNLTPVWNKSYREHAIVGTTPADTRREADEAVRELGWQAPYFVDADHITLRIVDDFVDHADFFTVDVAEQLGKEPGKGELDLFIHRHAGLIGPLRVPGIEEPFRVGRAELERAGRRYLAALEETTRIYQLLVRNKGEGSFVLELSMDETSEPQDPLDLLLILAEVGFRRIPLATIAPRFPGMLRKGVDFLGDLGAFHKSFRQVVAVIRFAVREFGLPKGFKVSFHSGSDKFSLYGTMRSVLQEFDAGLHIKTSGTTWLEELAGLAAVGGEGLAIAKEIYGKAYNRMAELTAPYATVVEIDPRSLPLPEEVNRWDEERFVSCLTHDLENPWYNEHFRQLLHVAYKIAAEAGTRFRELVLKHQDVISANVRRNILDRHIRPLFMGD
ncbi:MAG: tagaturonate epimerase family protein [candidate division KSB1 bacterium]|nr:tagaturonate epimerase family protein [candidate division KSB1 bacterium]